MSSAVKVGGALLFLADGRGEEGLTAYAQAFEEAQRAARMGSSCSGDKVALGLGPLQDPNSIGSRVQASTGLGTSALAKEVRDLADRDGGNSKTVQNGLSTLLGQIGDGGLQARMMQALDGVDERRKKELISAAFSRTPNDDAYVVDLQKKAPEASDPAMELPVFGANTVSALSITPSRDASVKKIDGLLLTEEERGKELAELEHLLIEGSAPATLQVKQELSIFDLVSRVYRARRERFSNPR